MSETPSSPDTASTPRPDAGGGTGVHASLVRLRRSAIGLWRARRWVRVVVMVVIAGLINVWSWPLLGLLPGAPGLDTSWQIGLHMAADSGFDFGRDIGFTYGPLGFLAVPQLVTGATAGWSFAFIATVRFLLLLVVLVAARRAFGHLVIAVGVCWLTASVLWEVTEFAGLLALISALVLIQQPVTGRWARLAPWALGASAGLLLLVKLNIGITAVIVLGVAAWFQPPGRYRAAAAYASAFIASVVVLWIASGNRIGDLVRWVGWSKEFTLGYAGGSMAEDGLIDRAWEYPAFLLMAAALVALAAWSVRRGRPRAHAIALVVVLVFGLWVAFKHGFVRHDAHVIFSFVTLAVLPATIVWRNDVGRIGGLVLVAVGVMLTFRAWGIPADGPLDPFAGRTDRLQDQVAVLLDGSRRDAMLEEGRAAFRAQLAVDESLIALIGRETVHVAPHEASTVWAYGLNWRPIPHLLSYTVWTTNLDEATHDFLMGSRAPRYILRQDIPRYDLHSPVWEAPGENLAMLCRYTQRATSGGWEVLERTTSRCNQQRRLGTQTVRAGQTLTIPQSRPDEIVFMRMTWSPGLGDRLRSLAFRPSLQPQLRLPDLSTQNPYRIPPALIGGPLLLRAPNPLAAPVRITRLLANQRVTVDAPQRLDVTFYALATDPPAG